MDGYEMLMGGAARGFVKTTKGVSRLRATGLTPRGEYTLYAFCDARALCAGSADGGGALEIEYPCVAGGVCLMGGARAALWSEGCDAVTLSCRVLQAQKQKPRKRYRRTARRFPRKVEEKPKKRTKRYRLIIDRRFARKRRLRARPDAPPATALPTLSWERAEKWKPYFELLPPCAPVRDRQWRFVKAKATDGGDCYLGMRAEGDAVAEIVAIPSRARQPVLPFSRKS